MQRRGEGGGGEDGGLVLSASDVLIISVNSATRLLFRKPHLTLMKRSKFTRCTWISSFERLKLHRKRSMDEEKQVHQVYMDRLLREIKTAKEEIDGSG